VVSAAAGERGEKVKEQVEGGRLKVDSGTGGRWKIR